MSEFKHYPVMLNEAVDALQCENGKIYVDATLGGGSYSELILKRIQPNGRLFSFDVDIAAIEAASEKLSEYKNLTIVNDSYCNIKKYLLQNGIEKIDGGIVFDLGASYPQLTSDTRGFSFSKDAKLDMRFNQSADFTAYDVVNGYKEDELVKIFSEYGEERFSKRIARRIIEVRKTNPISTTKELADLIIAATPRVKSNIHPATRVFQAVRIEVNNELRNIKNTLNEVLTFCSVGAIISVVTFHSLEDRIVKRFFKYHSNKCNCEPNQAICNCPLPKLEIINKKPLIATEQEVAVNPPSRSAKLRVAKRI
ncbi:MAG: 16S rRNA (cytosine(1402)-N(4))-methyltransferase RsmH [Candidatus Gastranaerophilales bacterium]|nr:16S rRNA (cytosine(1402)-N(4))-methyltransferase RsmH [Candidatus Gastranaerophilales bacterium]